MHLRYAISVSLKANLQSRWQKSLNKNEKGLTTDAALLRC